MKLSEEVIAILNDVCDKLGVAIDWTSENIVPYLTELAEKCVKYELVTSIMWIVGIGVLWATCFIGFYLCLKQRNKVLDKDVEMEEAMEILAAVLLVLGCIVLCLWFIVAACQTHDIIACLTFPEKIILSFVKSLRV